MILIIPCSLSFEFAIFIDLLFLNNLPKERTYIIHMHIMRVHMYILVTTFYSSLPLSLCVFNWKYVMTAPTHTVGK